MGMGAFDLLSAVRAAGGRETLGQIAKRMGIVPSSLTEAIAPAERRGFVERLTVDSNRRAKRILLTEAGERLLDECLAALQAQESRLREAIPTEELSRAIATLQKACETLAMHGHHKDG
jgi:MarR family transcriptional regulator for hemolysin